MIIQIKNSANTGNVPVSLANGELALNFADQKLFYKHANGSILILANGQSIGVDSEARLIANSAYLTANAAYDKANGAVQFGFPTINVAGQNNVIATSNNDVLKLVAGNNVTITTDAPNNIITISASSVALDQFARDTANAAYAEANTANATAVAAYVTANAAFDKANGAAQNAFTSFIVANQNTIVATTNTSILTLIAGESIAISTDSSNDTITLAVTTIDGGTF